jgi:hypothetical protein
MVEKRCHEQMVDLCLVLIHAMRNVVCCNPNIWLYLLFSSFEHQQQTAEIKR